MPRRVIVALILFLSATLAGPIAAEDSTPRLSVLLERLSRAATLFHDNALEFACDERIVWKGRGRGSGSANFEYIFAYDDRGELEKDRCELRTITTDFTETKNGLRLPGSIRIENASFWAKNRKRLEEHKKVLLEVEQTFTGYRGAQPLCCRETQ